MLKFVDNNFVFEVIKEWKILFFEFIRDKIFFIFWKWVFWNKILLYKLFLGFKFRVWFDLGIIFFFKVDLFKIKVVIK